MNRTNHFAAFVFGLALILLGHALKLTARSEPSTTFETVYMSRHCEAGWYVSERDGDRLVMACSE
jgi:hypothetical protein